MVRRDRDGVIVFSMYLPSARRVQLAGTFTDWSDGALDMKPVAGGWWTLQVSPPAGDHEFHYLIDDARTLADFAGDGIRMTPDGGWITLLSVAAGASESRAAA